MSFLNNTEKFPGHLNDASKLKEIRERYDLIERQRKHKKHIEQAITNLQTSKSDFDASQDMETWFPYIERIESLMNIVRRTPKDDWEGFARLKRFPSKDKSRSIMQLQRVAKIICESQNLKDNASNDSYEKYKELLNNIVTTDNNTPLLQHLKIPPTQ